ncbi:MAG: hypothetical protein U0Y68_13500 [Blastocatellia bacterium]
MNLEYRLIQLIPNLLRNEGRNVAVIAHDGKSAYFRAIGARANSSEVDLAIYRAIPGVPKQADWVYEEWIDWFNDLVSAEGQEAETLFQMLDELETQGKNFVVRGSGVVPNVEEGKSLRHLEEIFQTHVQEPSKPRKQDFQEQVSLLLQAATISQQPGFQENVEVEIMKDGKKLISLDFPYFLEGEKSFGFKTVKMRHNSETNLIAQVNDAYLTFERAMDLGFLKGSQCIVLSERPTEDRAKFADRLSDIARVVDVNDKDAVNKLGKLVFMK